MPTPKLLGVPCWVLPILAGSVWLVTLIILLATWMANGSEHYPEMWNAQRLAYISNIGASLWGRPIFTTGSVITACTLAVALIAERWMRHMGRLLHVSSRWMTGLSVVIAILLVSGSGCLIFLTIFDIRGRPLIHYPLVSVFVFGYIMATALMCIERKVLSNNYPSNKILLYSYHLKLFFIIAEVILAVICGAAMYESAWRVSVVTEWIIALFFTFYMWSCAIDFFTTTDLSGEDDVSELQAKRWDEEVGIDKPGKAKTVHKSYLRLP